MIELRNISDEIVLDDVSLSVRDGEYFVILGPTGSGKTVLLETIAGVRMPSSGKILVDGRDVSAVPIERRNVGFVYQDYMLFPHLNVSENIRFGLRTRKFSGLTPKQADDRVKRVAELLGIGHMASRDVATLSGGERQRVALARALVTGPDALLLDEPLSALDPRTREVLQLELKKLHGRIRTTTIHVTHDFEEAMRLADRIAVMSGGRIMQTGTPEQVFRKPETRLVAEFVGADNLFEGTASSSGGVCRIRVKGVAKELSALAEKSGRVSLCVRPEDVTLSQHACRCYGDMNVLRGRVAGVLDKGLLVRVDVDVGVPLTALVTRRAYKEKKLCEGARVYVMFKPLDVHVF